MPELAIQMQGNSLVVPTYILAIVGADLILGASWLAKLGLHVINYDKKVI